VALFWENEMTTKLGPWEERCDDENSLGLICEKAHGHTGPHATTYYMPATLLVAYRRARREDEAK